jgi:Glycosyltransferase family 87
MVAAFIATLAAMRVPLRIAVPLGLVIALVYPGAYGIGNPVPVIGLGMALAYRYRDEPALAGVGLALAISPKVSGAVLLVPFVVTGRYRAFAWGLGLLGLLALIPMAFQPDIWIRYLDAGVEGIRLNVNDNSLLTRIGLHWGLGREPTLVLLGLCSGLLALRTRDLYWPLCWLAVAALPILWMYSLLTLIPLLVHAVQRGGRWTTPLVVLAAGLTVASPPLGEWPALVAPVVLVLAFAALWSARPTSPSEGFWLSERHEARLGLDRRLRLDKLTHA